MKWLEVLNSLIIFSILLQPLGLVSVARAETVEMGYSDPDHLHAPKVVNEVEYQYDANGNLVNDGERVIFWNQDNLPVKIEKDGKVVEFFYDANGRRVVKKSDQRTQTYVDVRYQSFTDAQNNVSTTKYYFANGRRIALSSLTPSAQQPTLTYLHQDRLGSTVLATDSKSQKLTDPLSYFPYGSSTNNQQLAINNSYLFTGQELDSDVGLYNYNARLYNPTTGSFISADSVGGGNRYAYAANNPMVFTDPSGNDVWDVVKNVWETVETAYGSFLAEQLLYSMGEYEAYEKLSAETRDEKAAVVTAELGALNLYYSIPAVVSYLSFLYNYYTYSAPAEQANVGQIVGSADRSLVGWNWELREPGCRAGACGLASNMVQFEAEAAGATARMYQIRDVHAAIGVSGGNTFQHGFATVEVGGEEFLVDLTFSQFMDPVTGIVRQNPVSTGVSITDPFAQQLLTQGYVPLTQENLVRYLQLTSSAGVDVSAVTLDVLRSVTLLPWDYSVMELERLTGR